MQLRLLLKLNFLLVVIFVYFHGKNIGSYNLSVTYMEILLYCNKVRQRPSFTVNLFKSDEAVQVVFSNVEDGCHKGPDVKFCLEFFILKTCPSHVRRLFLMT